MKPSLKPRDRYSPRTHGFSFSTTCLLFIFAFICVHSRLISAAQAQPLAPATQPKWPAPKPLEFDKIVHKNARLLFVGDELTQQMFYVRGVACGLLALRPSDEIRIFNGGRDGATCASAGKWIDDLLDLTKPTAVFVELGLNHATGEGTVKDRALNYDRELRALVAQIQKYPSVEQVIVISPPPFDRMDEQADLVGVENFELQQYAMAGERFSGLSEGKVGFIDIFEHTRRVYVEAHKTEGEPLSLGGRLPTETGHMVVAAQILRGLGVTGPMFDKIGWGPLPARQMARVRPAFGFKTTAPKREAALRSRNLYEALVIFDERFFRQWRIAGSHPSAPSRDSLRAGLAEGWSGVQSVANEYAGKGK